MIVIVYHRREARFRVELLDSAATARPRRLVEERGAEGGIVGYPKLLGLARLPMLDDFYDDVFGARCRTSEEP